MQKKINFILKIFIGLVFILSAVLKLFPIEIFELNFVYHGISSLALAPYLSRILIALELFLGLALFFKNALKSFVLPAVLLLLIFFTAYLFYSMYKEGNTGNCGCFGTVLPMSPLQSLIKNIVLMAGVFYLLAVEKRKEWKFKWLLPVLFTVSLSVIFIFFPVKNYSGETVEIEVNKTADFLNMQKFTGEEKTDLKTGKKIVAFFSLGCDHCREMALKMSILKRRIDLPQPYFIFIGDSSEVNDFFNDTYINVPYRVYNLHDFFDSFRTSVPRIYLIQDGIIKHEWNYATFNIPDFEKAVIP